MTEPAETPRAPDPDAGLLARLRAKPPDEGAFAELVARYSPSMLRVALMYVPSRAVAEEVVQETWLGVLKGLERFEGRSSLKTWLFTILVNRARTRGERERRTVPFATLAGDEAGEDFAAVPLERFQSSDSGQPGAWAAPPERWEESPERSLRSGEAVEMVKAAIAELPETQRTVITMRDLEGFTSAEVCSALGITETNQRVLLHRARSKVRAALADYFSS